MTKPVVPVSEIGNYIANGYWIYDQTISGIPARMYKITHQNVTYNVAGLSDIDRAFVATAFQLWSDLSGLNFVESTSATVDINFARNSGYLAETSFSYRTTSVNGVITSETLQRTVNVGDAWYPVSTVDYNSYRFQTILHEIGHAIGLGHSGPYNGSGSYEANALYANDTWQYSVMSYFDQSNYNRAGFAYVATPQVADYLALVALYSSYGGTPHAGDTVYGFGSNAMLSSYNVFDFSRYSIGVADAVQPGLTLEAPPALTIIDAGGNDTLDGSLYSVPQTFRLTPGSFSDIGGYSVALNSGYTQEQRGIGNIGIAPGTIVENAVGGSSDDTFDYSGGFGGLPSGTVQRLDGRLGRDTIRLQGDANDYVITSNRGNSGRTSLTDKASGVVLDTVGVEKAFFTSQGMSSVSLTAGLYSEMANLSVAAYMDALPSNTSWHQVSAIELGIAPVGTFSNGTNYTYFDNLFEASSYKLGIYTKSDAYILAGVVNGRRSLCLVFRGTDEGALELASADRMMKGTFDQDFAPLFSGSALDSLESYLQENAITQVFVTGHSLGASMAQVFLSESLGLVGSDVSVGGFTFGAPGAESNAQATSIVNFLHVLDYIQFKNIIPGINYTVSGSVVYINNNSKHDMVTYSNDIAFLSAHLNDPEFSSTSLATAMRSNALYSGASLRIGVGSESADSIDGDDDFDFGGGGDDVIRFFRLDQLHVVNGGSGRDEVLICTERDVDPNRFSAVVSSTYSGRVDVLFNGKEIAHLYNVERLGLFLGQETRSFMSLDQTPVAVQSRTLGSTTFYLASGYDMALVGDGDNVVTSGTSLNDTIVMGHGSQLVYGGAGNDSIFGPGSAAGLVLEGGLGGGINATVLSYSDSMQADGGAGSDLVIGGGGADQISGGADNDRLDGSGGNDTVSFSYFSAGQNLTVALGVLNTSTEEVSETVTYGVANDIDTIKNFENITGGAGNDSLTGNDGANVLRGGAGQDVIFGGGGTDQLFGDDGDDTLVGNGGGADLFTTVVDLLSGGNGNDTIYAKSGDTIDGGAGRDVLHLVNDSPININLGSTGIEWIETLFGNDIIDGSTQTVGVEVYSDGGNDTITGSPFDDIIWSGSGNDVVTGGDGNDVIVGDIGADSLSGGIGNDRLYVDSSDTYINGGSGFDAVYITAGPGLSLSLATSSIEWVADFASGNDTIDGSAVTVNLEVYAGGGNDTVTGGSGNDFLWGNSGNDVLTGNSGNDTLVGGAGADILTGGPGIDTLYGNGGSGGDGAVDRFVFADNWGTDFVFDFEPGIDKLDLSAVTGLDTFAQLTLTNTADGHCYATFGTDLMAIAGQASRITQNDFIL